MEQYGGNALKMKVKSIKETQDASASFKNVQMFYCSNARPRLLFRVDDIDASIKRIQYFVARYKQTRTRRAR